MREQPFLPRRRSVRLHPFDYSDSHSYFVTICAENKRPIFGKIVNGEVALSTAGRIVDACWMEIPSHFPNVELAQHIVMPEHIHGIIRLRPRAMDGGSDAKVSRRARHAVPLPKQEGDFAAPTIGSIPTIVGAFKSAVTKQLNRAIWQRGYYEHVIRDDDEFRKTCEYIRANPARRALKKDFQ
jgi:putative transposase